MPITYWIIGCIALISISAFSNKQLFSSFLFRKGAVLYQKEWYRLVSHAALHADWQHLIFNMLALYFFGPYLEQWFELYAEVIPYRMLFIIFFIASIVAASSISLFRKDKPDYYTSVGASGGVAAVIGAVIVFDPTVPISFFFIPIPIPGYIFAALYVIGSAYANKLNRDNIAHDVHIAGILFGILFTLVIIPASRNHISAFFSQLFG